MHAVGDDGRDPLERAQPPRVARAGSLVGVRGLVAERGLDQQRPPERAVRDQLAQPVDRGVVPVGEADLEPVRRARAPRARPPSRRPRARAASPRAPTCRPRARRARDRPWRRAASRSRRRRSRDRSSTDATSVVRRAPSGAARGAPPRGRRRRRASTRGSRASAGRWARTAMSPRPISAIRRAGSLTGPTLTCDTDAHLIVQVTQVPAAPAPAGPAPRVRCGASLRASLWPRRARLAGLARPPAAARGAGRPRCPRARPGRREHRRRAGLCPRRARARVGDASAGRHRSAGLRARAPGHADTRRARPARRGRGRRRDLLRNALGREAARRPGRPLAPRRLRASRSAASPRSRRPVASATPTRRR